MYDTDFEAQLGKPQRFQCRHIFTDGHRCGSPSLRDGNFCYYHGTARRNGPRQPQVSGSLTPRKAARSSTFNLPSPADLAERSGVQLALGQILHKIANNEIDPRRAGLLLYGLQIASVNLARDRSRTARGEEGPVYEVTEDPDLGPLAPATPFHERHAEGNTLADLLEKLAREDRERNQAEEAAQNSEPNPLPTVHAAIPTPNRQHHCRATAKREKAPAEAGALHQQLLYAIRRRRRISAASPSNPVPINAKLAGSGVTALPPASAKE